MIYSFKRLRDKSLLTNFKENKIWLIKAVILYSGDPDLYIVEKAYDIHGRLIPKYKALHTKIHKDCTQFWDDYFMLEKLGEHKATKLANKKARERKVDMFNKDDLKTGDRVTYRNGSVAVVLKNTRDGDLLCDFGGGYMPLDDYKEDMITIRVNIFSNSDYDIVKVERIQLNTRGAYLHKDTQFVETIWERKEVKEISPEKACQIIKEAVGENVKIVI